MRSVVSLCLLAGCTAVVVNKHDLDRAKMTHPRPHLTADKPKEIRAALNKSLKQSPNTKPCAEFELPQLHSLLEELHGLRSDEIISLYDTADRRTPRHTTRETLVAEHEAEAEHVASHPQHHDAVRDSKCFEAAMQWAHHLPVAVREEWEIVSGRPVPLLPVDTDSASLTKDLSSDEDLAKTRSSVVSCETGHNAEAVEAGNWSGYPDWPDEVTYKARGYGPYPFWYAGSANEGSITGAGANISTSWSALKNAERIEHASCTVEDFGATSGDPCTHLFVNKWAALFAKDESWCCWSSTPNLPNCWMTTVKRDFYKLFQYNGVTEDYVSESGLYIGSVKNYSMVRCITLLLGSFHGITGVPLGSGPHH